MSDTDDYVPLKKDDAISTYTVQCTHPDEEEERSLDMHITHSDAIKLAAVLAALGFTVTATRKEDV